MLKKILVTLFLFITFFIGDVSATELGTSYDDVDTTRQSAIKNKMDANPALYQQVANTMKGMTKNGNPITADIVKQMVNDGGLIGPITKCAEAVSSGGASCGDGNGNSIPVAPNQTSTPPIGADTGGTEKKPDCNYDPDGDIREALEKCVGDSSLVQVSDAYVTGGLKDVLNKWIQRIAGFLALGAMFAIAFGSLKLTLSMGEDENIKKAKDIIKWGIIGFIAVISAGFLIATLVNLIYGLAA